jgi:hypothetical protein
MGVRLINWDSAGKMFNFTLPDLIDSTIEDAIDEAKQTYSNSIASIIGDQPGDWTPKSEDWARRSDKKLYFGQELQFISSVIDSDRNYRGIRAKRGDKKIFVGARHDIMHHSGYNMEQLAELLQATPDGSRDLFGRAYERVEDRIDSIFRSVGIKLK